MGHLGKCIVYVVEDDPSVLKALTRILQVNGFDVRPFASAEQFLRELLERDWGCVLLDITLHETTGMHVQIELQRRGIRWPVIAVSAREDEDTRRICRELGARFFLRKPVDAQALLDAIAWVTEQKYSETAVCGRVEPPDGKTTSNVDDPGVQK